MGWVWPEFQGVQDQRWLYLPKPESTEKGEWVNYNRRKEV